MPSIDVSQVPKLVEKSGYPVMYESYDSVAGVYADIVRTVGVDDVSSPSYGHREQVIAGFEPYKEREDGQPVEAATTKVAYDYYLKVHQYSRKIVLPKRLLDAADATSRVPSLIERFAQDRGEQAKLAKETFIANMFKQGTLTAGDASIFDGSHPGNVDPYPKFVYDGLPFFDGAHTLARSATTLANITTSLALTHANLETVITTMMTTNAVDEQGDGIFIDPDTLMVPPSLEFTARRIVGSILQSGTNNNDVNALMGRLNVVPNRFLTGAASQSAWWVGKAKRGVVAADSGVPMLRTYLLANGDVEVIAEYLFGAAVNNWRYWYCANKADS